MLTDIKTGNEHSEAFQEYLKTKQVDLGLDFTVQVLFIGLRVWTYCSKTLTSGHWPTHKTDDLGLPGQMVVILTTKNAHLEIYAFRSFFIFCSTFYTLNFCLFLRQKFLRDFELITIRELTTGDVCYVSKK